MDKNKAIEVIENLSDYAYENWEDDVYGKELDEIGEAVDFIKSYLFSSKIAGAAEIDGKKYLIISSEGEIKSCCQE